MLLTGGFFKGFIINPKPIPPFYAVEKSEAAAHKNARLLQDSTMIEIKDEKPVW